MPPSAVEAKCPQCKASEFEVRFLKEEGLAAAICIKCSTNFLLLDSGEYWFDVIQRGYPRISRCSCKSTSLELRFEYEYREDGDVRYVEVCSTCASCRKSKRQMTLDIDYGPTDHLVNQPLVYCKNPRVIFDLKELTLYVADQDIARIVQHLENVENCVFSCCIRQKGAWATEEMSAADIAKLLRNDGGLSTQYLYIHAMPKRIEVTQENVNSRVEATFWKRHEIIRISSPTNMMFQGTGHGDTPRGGSPIPGFIAGRLYYIHFSTEFVENEKVMSKSKAFASMTARFLEWMQKEFVSWRGPQCFDNPSEHTRLFGDRFQKKKKGR